MNTTSKVDSKVDTLTMIDMVYIYGIYNIRIYTYNLYHFIRIEFLKYFIRKFTCSDHRIIFGKFTHHIQFTPKTSITTNKTKVNTNIFKTKYMYFQYI